MWLLIALAHESEFGPSLQFKPPTPDGRLRGEADIRLSGEGAGRASFVFAITRHPCKTCDIKDPNQNITWVPSADGGGPNYSNM
jgi:Electron transfer flavoprotein-ubiquinone oxidoreductase, 4Fe-4S